MPIDIKTSRKKDYRVFSLTGSLDTQAGLELKKPLLNFIQNEDYNLCLDLSGVPSINAVGFKLIQNVYKNLAKQGRKTSVFGLDEKEHQNWEAQITPDTIQLFNNLEKFEASFTHHQEETRRKYFDLATGSDAIRRLSLICPFCEANEVTGYLCDEEMHELKWEDNNITPQWRLKEDRENEMDYEIYEIAVCHNCYFASRRLDHFIVTVPEGMVPSSLTNEEKDFITKKISSRPKLLSDHQRGNSKTFFTLPREQRAGYLAWQLYDQTIRDISKDKKSIDAIEVVHANVMLAKFAETDSERENAYTTAHVWATDIIDNQSGHLTRDLVMGLVYLISLNQALGKEKEAAKAFSRLSPQFKKDTRFPFWWERARNLLKRA
ncbi:MAG: STAS domain-containing protein [Fibrobacteria bacterium]|nr:STAS domain-containing protein [Fibrobacteria bacterium]